MWCFPSTPCFPGVVSRKSLQHFRKLHCLSHYTLEELKQSALSLSLSVHGTYLPVQYTHTQHFWHNFQEKCCQAWNLVILAILLYSPLLPPILICWTFWLDGLNKLTNLKFFRMPSHCLCTALLFAMHLLTGLLGIGWWGKSTDAKIYSAWNQLVARYISLQKECT